MKLNTIAPQKSRAQAMVEFAIVLPLLLLLVYGLLEAGRLLFMYSTVVTATRQASRYGSASGDGTTPGIPRYQDCAGIRLAANRVDFLNSFNHESTDVVIQWDTGPNTAVNDICPVGSDSENWTPTDNESRLLVTVTGHFNPIVPRIVPFLARLIEATSARTVITAIAIEVTPPPGSGIPTAGTQQLSLTMTASPTTFAFAGEVINFTYTLTNNGTTDLSGLVLTPTHGAVSCPGTTLAPGESMTCTGSYLTTSADVAAGSISAQGTASGTDGTITVTSNTATVVLTWIEQPRLELAKSASTEYATAGNTVVYTFTLNNTGNVNLTGATVTDAQLGGTVAGCGGDLAVGASLTCTANYVVTTGNVNSDQLVNTATASASYGTQTITSNSASVTVWTGPLFLDASVTPASVSAPGMITYTYRLINNTGVILHPPYSISGHRGSENCSSTASQIPVGGSMTCTGTYAVTQGDLDNASLATLDNNIQARACTQSNNGNCPGSARVDSNRDPVRVTLVRNPALTMQLTASPNPATTLGAVVTVTYTVTNSGNVTLSPTVTDNKATGISCSPASIAPGAVQTCTGTFTITQADLDAGSVSGQATATATFNSQTVSSASQAYTVLTFVGPRLRLQITPNPTTYTGVGQFIVYSYSLRNTGSVPLNGPYVITDNKVTFVDCAPATSPLAVGASTSCVGTYASTQADMDAGHIVNSAHATASDGAAAVTSNSAMAVVYVPGAPTLTPTPGPTATLAPTSACSASNVTLAASADSWVNQENPTAVNGGVTTLNILSRSGRNQRALVQFSLPSLPSGCVVQSATLRLFASSSTSGRTLQAWQIIGSWTEAGVNWNNQPGTTGAPATIASGSGTGYREWNVTSLVQTMYTSTNNGFLIKDAIEDEGGNGVSQQFISRENSSTNKPQLVITFGPAP